MLDFVFLLELVEFYFRLDFMILPYKVAIMFMILMIMILTVIRVIITIVTFE